MSTPNVKLRGYQRAQVDQVYGHWRNGSRNVLNVLPTGGGKTVEMAAIASEIVVPGVAIAHRRELINQISRAMASFGVRHNIIAADTTVKSCISRHVEMFGRSFYDPRATFTVSSVDTLSAREDKMKQWANTIGLWMVDECFLAGTLVDGTPIEQIKVGDLVTAFDEATGQFHKKPVTRLFKKPAPTVIIRVVSQSHHVLYVTGGHPFWTRRGWVNAGNLKATDEVLLVRGAGKSTESLDGAISKERPPVLFADVFDQIPGKDFIGNDGGNQPQTRFGAHDRQQSDAERSVTSEDDRNPESDWSLPVDSRWEWETADRGGSDAEQSLGALRVPDAGFGSDRVSERDRARTLQNRLCESTFEDSDRGGWGKSLWETADVRPPERCVSDWVRLDSLQVLKRDDSQFPGDGHVYNIEVADLHTYTANGIVVHNCHHVLSDNKWGRAVNMFPNGFGVGFTATPVRADRRSLARVQKGVFDAMVVGPSMRELITAGNLCEYRIFAPPASIDRAQIKISANGEFSHDSMVKVVHESKIVGDIVESYLRFAKGKRGITFVTDVEQAVEVAGAFRAAGVRAEAVSAKTPDSVREALMRKFEVGALDQLVNVDLFGEGLDVPAVEVVSMGRPTESYGLYVQQFGRALRILAGKSHGIIIDHVSNVIRHGLPDAKRTWSLMADQRGKRTARDPEVMPVTTCSECFKAYEAVTPVCPYCGYKPEPAGRSRPEQVDGDLIEMDPAALAVMRGEVDRIDGNPLIPYGVSDIVAGAIRRNWLERQDAQTELRKRIADWAGPADPSALGSAPKRMNG